MTNGSPRDEITATTVTLAAHAGGGFVILAVHVHGGLNNISYLLLTILARKRSWSQSPIRAVTWRAV